VLVNDNLLPSAGEQLFVTVIGTNGNAPNHGGLAVVNPAQTGLLYTPAQDFVGVETFTYEISYGTLARARGV